MKTRTFSRIAYLACVGMILLAAIWYSKWEKPHTEATLSWDVSGYYLYLPALFIYQDLDELAFMDEILEKYRPTPNLMQAFPHEDGPYIMQYSIGQAILYTPSFFLGHAWALLSDYPADGFSRPYQVAIHWGSLLMAFLGLWVLRLVLLRYFTDIVTGISLLVIVFATNYLNYAAIDSAMTHNYLFSLYALLIYLTIRLYEKPTFLRAAGVGLMVGLAALTRPSEIIAVIIPLAWGLGIRDIPKRLEMWKTHWAKLLLAATITVLVGSLQLIYWKTVGGDWLIYSYREQGFSWLRPHLLNVLFSYKKGWLVYTPVMSLAILGLIPLAVKRRHLFWGIAAFLAFNTWVVSAWDIWWYGGSFGQRAMVQSYALWAFPLAALLEWALSGKITRWALGLLLVFCSVLNLFQTWQIHGHGMNAEFMTEAYYWRIFFNTDVQDRDKFLMDTDADYQGQRADVRLLGLYDFEEMEDDSLGRYAGHPYTGEQAARVNRELEWSESIDIPYDTSKWSGKWLRIHGMFYPEKWVHNIWNQTQLVVQFHRDGRVARTRFIRLERVAKPGQWNEIRMDVELPGKPFNFVRIFLYVPGGDQVMYMDDVRVESFREP